MTITRRSRLSAYSLMVFLVAGCATVSAQEPVTTISAPSPPTSINENGTVLIPPLVIEPPVVIPVADPEFCINGEPFIRLDEATFCVSKYHPLIPLTISQMVDAVGLPAIFKTTIIPRESGGNPRAVNRWDCRGLSQHCGKAGRYRALGYTWDDAFNPWPHLIVTKELFDESGLAPWRCSRCSLKS